MTLRISLVSSAALAIALAANSANAQTVASGPVATPQAQQPGSPAGDVDAGIGDIIVTAQRTEQSLQRVPVTVQAITAADLGARKINDLVQLESAVPSLGVGTDNSFSLRGVGSLSFSPLVDSSVGVSVDEVSLGVPIVMNYFGFTDVDRVEVLSGPQGLLFGRNASAGLLNIVTTKPKLGSAISGNAYGETDYRDTTPNGGGWGEIVRGTINVPIGDTAAFRLNALYSNQDTIAQVINPTPRANFGDYQRRLGFRGKFLYEPSDGLSIYLVGDYAQNRGIGGIYDRTLRYAAPGSATGAILMAGGITPGPDNLLLGWSAPGRDGTNGGTNVDTGGASINASYRLSSKLTVSDIFAWRAYKASGTLDADYTDADGVDVNSSISRYHQFSNEFRLTLAPGSLIDGQAGVYYFGSRLRKVDAAGAAAYHLLDPVLAGLVGPSDSVTNPYLGADVNANSTTSSVAGFGQVNIHPVDRVTLILGGRVTHDDDTINIAQNLKPYPIPLGVSNYRSFQRVKNTDFSWKVGGQYDFPNIGMLYATYSKGYKGPAFNGTVASATQNLAIGPETVHALEIGAKTTLFDRRLRLNVSAFRELFEDIQVQGYDPVTAAFFTSNAAKARSQGVEVQVEARPVRHFTLSGAATFLDSKFQRFTNDHCYPGQASCTAVGTTDSSGNRTPSSARFTSNVTAAYEAPISSSATFNASASYYHRSSINFSSNDNPQTALGAIDTLDGTVGLTIDGRYRLSVFCKNCTDKRYPLFIGSDNIDGTLLNLNSTVQTWGYNSVRTFGVSAGFDF